MLVTDTYISAMSKSALKLLNFVADVHEDPYKLGQRNSTSMLTNYNLHAVTFPIHPPKQDNTIIMHLMKAES